MNRREFLRSASVMSASVAFPTSECLLASDATSARWRTFDVTTRVEILKFSEATRVWLPAALTGETPFQKTLSKKFNADGGTARMVEIKADGLGILAKDI
jgi:hypothetical protein